MERLEVRVAGGAYPILIGAGISSSLGALEGVAPLLLGRRVAVVTDANVRSLHGDALEDSLLAAGAKIIARSVMRPGEENKNLAALSAIWDDLIGAGIERADLVVAHGGGVVGDVAGFAAATVLRGVDFMQVPTTLLAMVDSSVGGKTGIDHPRGKNLLGAFHQPSAVVADTSFLATLPRREALSGLAESIKAAILGDAGLFEVLERSGPGILEDEALLSAAIAASVGIKARVVGADEREAGGRALLNLGHTFGHAVENALGYSGLTHGEAVAVGMVFAARLSRMTGRLDPGDEERIVTLLGEWGYPMRVEGLDPASIRRGFSSDKKSSGGRPRWVLPTGIGRAEFGVAVDDGTVDRLLEETQG